MTIRLPWTVKWLTLPPGAGRWNTRTAGLEKELAGMNVGDKKTVTVKPEEGYGLVREDAIKRVPKEAVSNAEELKVGDMVGASNGEHTFRAIVKEIGEKEITLDFNHPLAGKELVFEVEIKEIN